MSPSCAVWISSVALGAWLGCSRTQAPSEEGAASPLRTVSSPSAPAAAATAAPAPVATARVTLDGAKGPVTVEVEVVQSQGLIQRGLMYRQYLAPDAGMLFLMDEETVHHFWMKNTLIPLDILFIGRDHKVVGILCDMKPHDTTPRAVDGPSLYVLEVNAGWSKLHGVDAGSTVHFDGVEAAAR